LQSVNEQRVMAQNLIPEQGYL